MLNLGRCRLFASEYPVRALDLVGESNVIDMLGLLTLNWQRLDRWCADPATFNETEFQKLRASGIRIFNPAVAFYNRPYEVTTEWFAKWNRLISHHAQYFVRVDSPADLTHGKIGIILGMQDANHFRTVEDVNAFYAQGQRISQITYNGRNLLGSGCLIANDRGLTPFGHNVIARMNEIGMAVDISHSGERTSLEAIEASIKPVLITHSNCRALAPHAPRCKSDEVILAMAHKGGVIGMTGIPGFVRDSGPVTIENALDHFDHARDLVGVEHIGIGSDNDLDGRQHGIAGLNHPRRIYDLTAGLIRRGYNTREIGLVLGGNFERALRQSFL
jgi:membrane dipeptidase